MTDFAVNQNIGEQYGRISVQQLAEYLAELTAAKATGQIEYQVQLIDVREPQEIAIAYIPGFKVLPLSEFAQWSTNIAVDFDLQLETWVLCHHGIRSAQMCGWLVQQGFSNVKNISGGISAYSAIVDPSIRQY